LLALLLIPRPGSPYSVQTHEQLIDLAWKQSIRPLLLQRYPTLTEAQIKEAHAYAYGGCAIQDLGYYPFGNTFFSDLTHYVRTGDFILNLLRDSSNANELAFAVGAMSHYLGDTIGHADAVNPSVAIEFPKLKKKYGSSVNYAESAHAHVRTEFAFDIDAISKSRFAPAAYLRYIGLEVPIPLLRRAFFETYGLDLREILGDRKPVLRGYRFAVRSFLPRIAYAEVILHKKTMPPDTPGEPFDLLKSQLAQSAIENNWDQHRKKPGIGTYSLAGLIFILPKVGVFSNLAIRGPSEQTHEKYVESLNRTIDSIRRDIRNFDKISTALPNRDLDTGAKVKPGGYRLTDDTYAKLLDRLVRDSPRPIPIGLQQDITEYYADPTAPIVTKNNPEKWARVQAELKLLQTMPTTRYPDGVLTPDEPSKPGEPSKSEAQPR
jgi:Zinc dependent phospholipase C